MLGGSRVKSCRFLFGGRKDRDADATTQADLVTGKLLCVVDCRCSFVISYLQMFHFSERIKLCWSTHEKITE
jgi:hypothetical protein